ncbi:MAG: c-type cytochrome [Trichloromonadaceae bacterium]
MLYFLAALYTAAVILVGCSRDEAPPPPSVQTTAPQTQTAAEPLSGPVVTADPATNLEMGERYYQRSCASCHDSGAGGAPLLGDQSNWKPRIDQGLETLVHHAIEGFKSSACVMPPRGGDAGLRIEAVALAVRYMVEKGLPPEAQVPPEQQKN